VIRTSAEVHRAILDTASRLFYQNGIRAVGVDRIIADSGVAKASFYKHFPSKDELVATYLETTDADYIARLRAEVDALAKRPADKPLAVFDAFGERLSSRDFRGCAFNNAVAEMSADLPKAAAIARRNRQSLRAYLAELCDEAGYGRSADRLAEQFVLIIDGAEVAAARRDRDAAATAKAIARALLTAAYEPGGSSLRRKHD
jgi:AcrR family transcriptional regulator